MSLARDSGIGGFVLSCLYMSWSLYSLLFSIVHMVVPSGLCNVVCVCVCVVWGVVCVSSYRLVGCVSRSGLMGVVVKVTLGDLHPSSVFGLTLGVRLFVLLWVCVLYFY